MNRKKRTAVSRVKIVLVLSCLMIACLMNVMTAFAEDETLNANAEETKETKQVTVIASGTGWNLDADGGLHILGAVRNPSTDSSDNSPWRNYKLDIKSVDTRKGSSIDNGIKLFEECTNLETADLSNLNVSDVTSMYHMFSGCSKLKSVNCSNWNTANVISVYDMFCGCEVLQSMDFSKWDMSRVTNMRGMFYHCYALTSVNASNSTTGNVTNMDYLFDGCRSLKTVIISELSTKSVKDMTRMFFCCESLVSIDVSKFNTANVETMSQMFYNCKSLKSINLSNFSCQKLINLVEMFYNCESLQKLDLSNMKFADVSSPKGNRMVHGTYGLEQITVNEVIIDHIFSDLTASCPQWANANNNKVYITADDYQSISGTVTLRPNSFPIDKVTNAWYGTTLKWTPASKSSVTVYRRSVESYYNQWEELATVTTGGYYDKTATNHTRYKYALIVNSGIKGPKLALPSMNYYMESPEIDTVTNGTGMVIVRWYPVNDADGYYVYRKETNSGTWHMIGSTQKNNYFVDKNVANGGIYYYAIKSFSKFGTAEVKGISASSSARNTVYVKNNYISKLSNPSAGAMKVEFSTTTNCTGYELYYGIYSYDVENNYGGTTVDVAKGTATGETIKNLQKGRTYYVKVRPYKVVAGYVFYGNWSAVKSVKIDK